MRSGRPFKFALTFGLVAVGSASTVGEGLLNAGVAAARDAINVMDERSPGVRTEASMTKGKPRIDVGRVARALPRIRDARASSEPPAAGGGPPGAVAALPADALPGIAAPAAAGLPVALAEAPGGGFVGGPGGFFLPPVGGGGGIIVPPVRPSEETPETPVAPPIVITPVPEPASWAMMILGFAVVGAATRRRREPLRA